jgi:hypothetical protein
MWIVLGDEVGADQGAGGEECCIPLHFEDCGWGNAFNDGVDIAYVHAFFEKIL